MQKCIPYGKGDIRFFSHKYPVKFLSKNLEDYPDSKKVYKIKSFNQKHRTFYIYEAITDYEGKWEKGDVIQLYPSLCYGKRK